MDPQAWLNLENSIDDVTAALEEGSLSANDQRLKILGLKEEMIDYAESINLPDKVTTEIAALVDEGKLAEAKAILARFGDGITVPLKPQFINTGGARIRMDEHGNLRHYDKGGVAPGPRGSEQLAVVHGGETILPTHKPGGQAPAGVDLAPPNVNVSVTLDGRELKALVRTEIDEHDRRLTTQIRQGRRA